MNSEFPRILTLLRKEKGISQKAAAQRFGISQALLSHYEKGIRECGLDFLMTVADEYSVSVDYLLGRTADRQGARIVADEIPEYENGNDKVFTGSVVSTLNKKLIMNSVGILFDRLRDPKLKDLASEVGTYLSLAVYKMFRLVYFANPKNPRALFSVKGRAGCGLCTGAMANTEAYVTALCDGEQTGDYRTIPAEKFCEMSPELLSSQYPLAASSLFNLIGTAESRIAAKPKKSGGGKN